MGLDMYLKVKRTFNEVDIAAGLPPEIRAAQDFYCSAYEWSKPEDIARYQAVLKLMQLDFTDVDRGTPHAYRDGATFGVMIGYWRKANHIHRWFVENVQGGEDKCEPHDVTVEQLQQLKTACEQALAVVKDDPEAAGKILPPQEGFFFGGTEIDESYIDDLNATVDIIDRCLEPKVLGLAGSHPVEFEYRSSW